MTEPGTVSPEAYIEMAAHAMELEHENKRLREGLERIRIASEFHAQDGVAANVAQYAHESTKRLCDELLSPIKPEKQG